MNLLFASSKKYTTTVRQFKFDTYNDSYEIETFINTLDTTGTAGKEVVILIDTEIKNGKTFFTDANGLEL